MSIRIAGNTMIPTLHAISAKGYEITLWHTQTKDGGLNPQYDAAKDGSTFSATSPEELLGLIAMWEIRGDEWQMKSGESLIYDDLLDASVIFDSDGNIVDA